MTIDDLEYSWPAFNDDVLVRALRRHVMERVDYLISTYWQRMEARLYARFVKFCRGS